MKDVETIKREYENLRKLYTDKEFLERLGKYEKKEIAFEKIERIMKISTPAFSALAIIFSLISIFK